MAVSLIGSQLYAQELLDELNGSSLGDTVGIQFISTPSGQGALFTRLKESRIEYPFAIGFPKQGTVEILINVKHGYSYNGFTLFDHKPIAKIFNTGNQDIWQPGAMFLDVEDSTGRIYLTTATAFAQPQSHALIADSTPFRFNEWHVLSFSFGSEGQYISVDGQVVARDTTFTESMGVCTGSNTMGVLDHSPTFGEVTSKFWDNNQYDNGFEGIIDKIRISHSQQDWKLSNATSIEAYFPNDQQTINVTKNYPNPFNTLTYLDFEAPIAGIASLQVYSSEGRQMAISSYLLSFPGSQKLVFDGTQLPPGIYYFELKIHDIRYHGKMIKR